MKPTIPQFPAICMHGHFFWVVHESIQLETCTKEDIKGPYYRDMKLFDAGFRQLAVAKIESMGPYGPLWVFSLFRKRGYRVNLTFDLVRIVAYPEIRDEVANIFQANPFFWNSYGDPVEFAAECKALGSWNGLLKFLERFQK